MDCDALTRPSAAHAYLFIEDFSRDLWCPETCNTNNMTTDVVQVEANVHEHLMTVYILEN